MDRKCQWPHSAPGKTPDFLYVCFVRGTHYLNISIQQVVVAKDAPAISQPPKQGFQQLKTSLQIQCFNSRQTAKINQKSIKYRSGDGTKQKNNPKLSFPDFSLKMSQNGSRKRGRESSIFLAFCFSGACMAPRSPHAAPG